MPTFLRRMIIWTSNGLNFLNQIYTEHLINSFFFLFFVLFRLCVCVVMYLPVTEIMAVFSFLKKKKVGSKLEIFLIARRHVRRKTQAEIGC